jgi:small-conductance mechanosensitive channel
MSEFIHRYLGIDAATQIKLLSTLILFLILSFIYRIIAKYIIGRLDDVKQKYQWRKIALYLNAFIGFLLLLRIWFGTVQGLTTYLGLLSAGVAIAFKDPLVNLGGWIFIVIRKPFRLGDRIQINNVIGDVVDIRIFQFSVMEVGNWVDAEQSTGRIVHIPNSVVFTTPQANYTAGFEYIWDEIPVLVTFESNWKKAKKILEDILDKHTEHFSEAAEKQIKEAAKKYLIYYSKLTPIVYVSVKDSGVMLTLRYLTRTRQRRATENVIWQAILDQFALHDDIDFAYPTQRFYNNLLEGKPGTKPGDQPGE